MRKSIVYMVCCEQYETLLPGQTAFHCVLLVVLGLECSVYTNPRVFADLVHACDFHLDFRKQFLRVKLSLKLVLRRMIVHVNP